MLGSGRQCLYLIAVALTLLGAGCMPRGSASVDEQKDPWFLKGKRLLNGLDYQGAIEAFNKALEANPRSASAHKELGVLHYKKTQDHAAAIYHLQRTLDLRPEDPHAETLREFVLASKQELAREVNLEPVNREIQKDLERIEELSRQVVTLTREKEELLRERSDLTRRLTAMGSTPPPSAVTDNRNLATATVSVTTPRPGPRVSGISSKPRLHTVASGENLYSIAQRYGIKQRDLQVLNSHVDPRRMQIGTVLRIPPEAAN